MGTASDLLRLGRAQTAAVEGAGFPLAAWIGGAPLWTLPVFALLGVIAHLSGFGENSLTDLEFDRKDPSKADHPVVAGRISVRGGWTFVLVMQAMAIVVLALLTWSSGHWVAWVPFIGYIGLGHAYNLVGKKWKPGAVLEISGAFALAFLAMAMVWTGRFDNTITAVAVYAFLFTGFQIAIAGELKELGQPNERNLLRNLGTRVTPEISPLVSRESIRPEALLPSLVVSEQVWAFAFILSAAKAIAIGTVGWMVLGPEWGLIIGAVSGGFFVAYTVALLRPGPYDRPRLLRIMGGGEAASYVLLVLALAPTLWPWLLVAFIVAPVVWFISMNRLLWNTSGSAWAPGV